MKVPTASSLGPLNNRSVVVIIGGGPAGTTCAIALKKLAQARGITPRIVLYEGKIFEKKSYYNQCLGVLSPPLDKIMADDLGLPFPYHLIQRQIDGYVIHTDMMNFSWPVNTNLPMPAGELNSMIIFFSRSKNWGLKLTRPGSLKLKFPPNG